MRWMLLLLPFAALGASFDTETDVVRSIEKKSGHVRVTFWELSAFYTAPAGNEKLLETLEESRAKNLRLRLTVNPETLEIVEAVPR